MSDGIFIWSPGSYPRAGLWGDGGAQGVHVFFLNIVMWNIKSTGMTSKKIVSMIWKYHNHKLQTTPWHREEEPLNRHERPGRQIKQSYQLSLPHQDDCNARMDIK